MSGEHQSNGRRSLDAGDLEHTKLHPPVGEETTNPSNDVRITLDTPVIEAENEAIVRHCVEFNIRAFGVDTTKPITVDNCYISKDKSTQLNDADWANHIHTLRNWTQNDKVKSLAFRRANSNGYNLIKKFKAVAEAITEPSAASTWQLYKLNPKKIGGGAIVVPMSGVFEAIYAAHLCIGHGTSNDTYKEVSRSYANITSALCQHFCFGCHGCKADNPIASKQKAAKKPKLSAQFRDRFQIDFIDMSEKNEKDIYGVTQLWLLSLKDNVTQLVAFRSIPLKTPQYVAHELSWMFGLIGFPNILQSNDCPDINILMKELDPSMAIVTGRPSKPKNEHGSVENLNMLTKRVLSNIEQEERQKGNNHPNWTMYLGRMMSAINSKTRRGKNSVAAYNLTFGMPFERIQPFNHDNLLKGQTIEDRLLPPTSPRFDKVAKELCDRRDDPAVKPCFEVGGADVDSPADTGTDPNGDWGLTSVEGGDDDDEPPLELDHVNVGIDSDVCVMMVTPAPAIKMQQIIKMEPDVSLPCKNLPSTGGSISLQEAYQLNIECHEKRSLLTGAGKDRDQYGFIYATLSCDCCFAGSFCVSVGDKKYLAANRLTKRWFETDFVASFSAIVAHRAHSTSVVLVHCQYPTAVVTAGECRNLHRDTREVLSVLHCRDHFSVLKVSVRENKLFVFDGIPLSLGTWFDHATNIMKRCRLLPLDSKRRWQRAPSSNDEYTLNVGDTSWTLNHWPRNIQQEDSYNCGPIACLILMKEYGFEPDITVSRANIREVVVNFFETQLNLIAKDLIIRTPVDDDTV